MGLDSQLNSELRTQEVKSQEFGVRGSGFGVRGSEGPCGSKKIADRGFNRHRRIPNHPAHAPAELL